MVIDLWDRERRIDMKIRIPDIEGNINYIENKKSIVLIGANGAGKTRMSIWIDETIQILTYIEYLHKNR